MTDPDALRAITLDLDDTLWPVGPTLVAAESVLAEWLRTHAPRTAAATTPQARAAIRQALLAERPEHAHDMSFLRREGLRRAMLAAGDDPALAEPAFEVFLDARQRVEPFDDVVPVLSRWARRFRIVAVTNGNADVGRTGLGAFFVGAVSAHELGCAKPDPRMFHAACRVAGVEPAQVLHVGDDPHLDVLARPRPSRTCTRSTRRCRDPSARPAERRRVARGDRGLKSGSRRPITRSMRGIA
jgi:putative hydrolase of the HAD superfamily